jgi:CBS domain-containing protein
VVGDVVEDLRERPAGRSAERLSCLRRAVEPTPDGARSALAIASACAMSENSLMTRQRLTVENLMTTSVIALQATDPIAKAITDMDVVGVHHFPVIDEQNRVVGVISDRDLLRALAAGNGPADPVAIAMMKEVRTATADLAAVEALDLMLERRITALPVVSDDGTLSGIVTTTDFLKLASQTLHGEQPGRDPME